MHSGDKDTFRIPYQWPQTNPITILKPEFIHSFVTCCWLIILTTYTLPQCIRMNVKKSKSRSRKNLTTAKNLKISGLLQYAKTKCFSPLVHKIHSLGPKCCFEPTVQLGFNTQEEVYFICWCRLQLSFQWWNVFSEFWYIRTGDLLFSLAGM